MRHTSLNFNVILELGKSLICSRQKITAIPDQRDQFVCCDRVIVEGPRDTSNPELYVLS